MQNRPLICSRQWVPLPFAPPWFEWCSALLLATASMVAAAQGSQPTPARSGHLATGDKAAAAVARNASPGLPGASVDAAFRRADSDGDGRLSRQETDHFPMLAERFEQFDRDRDRHLSREEFQHAARE